MKVPKLYQIIFKDLFDFAFIFLVTVFLTMAVYFSSPAFKEVYLSLYFFEQFIELLLENPKLFLWFMAFGLGVSLIYFLFGALAFHTTLGGRIFGVAMTQKNNKPLSAWSALLLGVGAYFGVIFLCINPFYAWWLDPKHRGLAFKMARVYLGTNS